jgi:hypothetical protein
MNAKEFLYQEFPDRIAKEYSETKELILARFDGWEMIEFAEEYHQAKMKEGMDGTRIIGNVRERFREIFSKDRQWDEYRSFYNGWIEGRTDLLFKHEETK